MAGDGSSIPRANVRSSASTLKGRRIPPTVHIVGAGPGAPDLLTVRAHQLIAEADLVVCDELVPNEIRHLADGELRVARRSKGAQGPLQMELQAWVVESALSGRRVVRLKAGDPLLFGRAAEEVAAYESAGLYVRLVPGVSSVTAAGVDARASLTERDTADRVLIVTGHRAEGRSQRPIPYDMGTTVVVLMGVSTAGQIATSMMSAGWPEATPAVVVERAAQDDGRSLRCYLDDLGRVIETNAVQSPAVIMIGEAALGMGRARMLARTKSLQESTADKSVGHFAPFTP